MTVKMDASKALQNCHKVKVDLMQEITYKGPKSDKKRFYELEE
jgi:hypothetical protein